MIKYRRYRRAGLWRIRFEVTPDIADNAREFATAHKIFTSALAVGPEDAILSMFAERSKCCASKAPHPDWRGFETLNQK